MLRMDTSWSLPEFRLGDTFDRLPAPSLLLVRWRKAEEEEEPFRMGSPPQKKPRGDSLKISEAIGQVMVINGEDALPSSSINNAPEEPRKEEHTSEY